MNTEETKQMTAEEMIKARKKWLAENLIENWNDEDTRSIAVNFATQEVSRAIKEKDADIEMWTGKAIQERNKRTQLLIDLELSERKNTELNSELQSSREMAGKLAEVLEV